MKRLSLLLCLFITSASAQAQSTDGASLFFDAVPFAATTLDSTRIDLYLAIPASAVTYERKGGAFTARYQAQIRVEGEGRTWYDSTFVRSLRAASYEITTGESKSFEFYQQRLVVPPGSYSATVDVVDLRTNLHTTLKRAVTAKSLTNAPFALSGLLLVRKIREDSGSYVITPLINESIGSDDDGYFVFFEVYNNGAAVDAVIDATYRGDARTAVAPVQLRKGIPAGRSQQWVRMPAERVPRGAFTLTLRVASAADSAHALATAERAIRLEGIGAAVPLVEEELNERITQLRYAANLSEIENIRAGTSLQDRQRRYAEFWNRLDPTPGTSTNEAMEEYFRRIDYADDHFRSYAAGWLTDKGRVWVTYGPPDNLTSDPFRSDGKAVETWQYFRRNLRITFVDETGFGDYRLVTPIPLSEKYRYGS